MDLEILGRVWLDGPLSAAWIGILIFNGSSLRWQLRSKHAARWIVRLTTFATWLAVGALIAAPLLSGVRFFSYLAVGLSVVLLAGSELRDRLPIRRDLRLAVWSECEAIRDTVTAGPLDEGEIMAVRRRLAELDRFQSAATFEAIELTRAIAHCHLGLYEPAPERYERWTARLTAIIDTWRPGPLAERVADRSSGLRAALLRRSTALAFAAALVGGVLAFNDLHAFRYGPFVVVAWIAVWHRMLRVVAVSLIGYAAGWAIAIALESPPVRPCVDCEWPELPSLIAAVASMLLVGGVAGLLARRDG